MTDPQEELEEALWPDVPRVCFASGPHFGFNANVAWVQARREFLGYVEGYRRAAIAVFDSLQTTNQSPDYMVWPLVFLWRHHVELAIKDIVLAGAELADEVVKYPGHHVLMDLWKMARPYIEECGPPDSPILTNVEANIAEFDGLDRSGFGFRYPLDNKGVAPSLKNAPELLNLAAFQEAMLALSNFFDGVRMEMTCRLEYVHQANAEAQDW